MKFSFLLGGVKDQDFITIIVIYTQGQYMQTYIGTIATIISPEFRGSFLLQENTILKYFFFLFLNYWSKISLCNCGNKTLHPALVTAGAILLVGGNVMLSFTYHHGIQVVLIFLNLSANCTHLSALQPDIPGTKWLKVWLQQPWYLLNLGNVKTDRGRII